jgi:pyridoxamine 5'-phosphate oxidase
MPDVRMVLMNGRDSRGFVFYTNFQSAKGRQLLARPRAALLLHWKSLRRQVRARGPVEVVSPPEADAYFASRARGSQIASSASDQSRPLDSRASLNRRVAALTQELEGQGVRRPVHWSGYRLVPLAMEFWQDGAFRLHDRMQFRREAATAAWQRRRLDP